MKTFIAIAGVIGIIAAVLIGSYVSNYNYGYATGTTTYYYENGKEKATEKYVNGDKHGKWVFFDESGKKTKEKRYYNNLLISE